MEIRSYWQTHIDDGVFIARFSNTPTHYFTDEAVAELDELVATWNRPEISAVVLAGASRGHFITHFDPEQIRRGLDDPIEVARRGPFRSIAVGRVLEGLTRLPVPVIVAMNGDTMGFGLELALACDLRIGERGDYRYGLPEVRLGITPGSGGMQRLARLVGLGPALNIVMRAQVMTPEAAERAGLLSELHDDAFSAAIDIAREFTRLPREAVSSAKRALHAGVDASLSTALAIEREANIVAKLSPGAHQALDRYLALPFEARRSALEVSPITP